MIRLPCLNCQTPNSAVEALFHYENSVHEPGAIWNYYVCATCAAELKRARRRVISIAAPVYSAPNKAALQAALEHRETPRERERWWQDMETERYQDDLEFDAMTHDRG